MMHVDIPGMVRVIWRFVSGSLDDWLSQATFSRNMIWVER